MASPTRPHGLTTCNNRRRRLSIPTDKYNKKRNYLPASALEPGAWAWQRRRSFVYKCRGWLGVPGWMLQRSDNGQVEAEATQCNQMAQRAKSTKTQSHTHGQIQAADGHTCSMGGG